MLRSFLPSTTSGGSPIVGGSGTTNTIPIWTAASTLGNSSITDDGTKITLGRKVWQTVDGTTTQQYFAWGDGTTAYAQIGGYRDSATTGHLEFYTLRASGGLLEAGRFATDGSFCINRGTAIGTNCLVNVQLSGTTASGYTAPSNAAALFDCGTATNGGIGLVGGGALGYYFANSSGAYDGGVEYSARKLYLRSQGTQALTVDGGNIYGTSGTTGMTNGFFYIPSAAGAPSGTPTAVSGRVPMYYDSTNNKFYVYNGAWKGVTLA